MAAPSIDFALGTILHRINAGILLIDKDYQIHFANDWIRASTHLDIGEKTGLLDIFTLTPRELKRLNRKIQTALQLHSPSFSSAEHDGYLLPIENRKVFNPHFKLMQQEVAIVPLTSLDGSAPDGILDGIPDGLAPDELALDDLDSHARDSDALSPHGLSPHGLGPHGLGPHGLSPHGLGPHGLGPHGLGPRTLPASELILILIYDQTALMISRHEVLQQSQDLAQALQELQVAHQKLSAQTALIERQANYDELTGLPNWTLFKDRLQGAIRLAAEKQVKVGVLYLDLDCFKPINDRYGHPFGDQILRTVAEILLALLKPKDTAARLSGDEFAVVICELEHAENLVNLADRILRQIAERRTVDDREIFLSASIGISLYPDDGEDHATLLKRADLAMVSAKTFGRGTFRFFTETLDRALKAKILLQTELAKALADKQFYVVYQPKYLAKQDRPAQLVGAEALIRSTHPELAALGPAGYIPLAEKMGLIRQLTEFVIQSTCRVLQILIPQDKAVPISINLSASDLADPEFCEQLIALVTDSGIDSRWLQLELTEHSAISSPEEDIQRLRFFRKKGFSIALDDFGTGYSSLSQLAALPIDVLKIDKSFVDQAQTNPQQQTLIRTIIHLAHALGIEPLTEGVEDVTSIQLLQDFGCELFQGYFFSHPLAEKDFIDLCLGAGL